jgi:hypothetical protein
MIIIALSLLACSPDSVSPSANLGDPDATDEVAGQQPLPACGMFETVAPIDGAQAVSPHTRIWIEGPVGLSPSASLFRDGKPALAQLTVVDDVVLGQHELVPSIRLSADSDYELLIRLDDCEDRFNFRTTEDDPSAYVEGTYAFDADDGIAIGAWSELFQFAGDGLLVEVQGTTATLARNDVDQTEAQEDCTEILSGTASLVGSLLEIELHSVPAWHEIGETPTVYVDVLRFSGQALADGSLTGVEYERFLQLSDATGEPAPCPTTGALDCTRVLYTAGVAIQSDTVVVQPTTHDCDDGHE